MDPLPKAWMSWSSGKDSTLALHRVRTAGEVEVVALLTTVNAAFARVAMHGVRRALLDAQAAALSLPLHVVELPWPCSNEVYEQLMGAAVAAATGSGIDAVVFGDLFLQDVRAYRERALAGTGLAPLFPLWEQPTDAVARELLELGVRAVVSCVDTAQAPPRLAGRWYDEAFLAELPAGLDPCGENGEFHTVVVDGPGFASPIPVTVGETVERDGFIFADVIPEPGPPAPGSASGERRS
jgi:uncharacterized protein (TIGR00290 family)